MNPVFGHATYIGQSAHGTVAQPLSADACVRTQLCSLRGALLRSVELSVTLNGSRINETDTFIYSALEKARKLSTKEELDTNPSREMQQIHTSTDVTCMQSMHARAHNAHISQFLCSDRLFYA